MAEMYRADDENRFLEVTYQNGDKEILYYRDFASGAMIENIVRRAKKLAIKRAIAGEGRGVRTSDLLESIRREYKENEDLPNTTNPDDWARISGKKGERIVYVRTLLGRLRREPVAAGRSSGWAPASTSEAGATRYVRGARPRQGEPRSCRRAAVLGSFSWRSRRSAASRPSTGSITSGATGTPWRPRRCWSTPT